MTIKSRARWAASASILVMSAAIAAGARAADPTPTDTSTAIGEVVVTARLRTERLQDVPISVTALSRQQLKDRNVRDVSDFIAMVPNMSIVQSESAGLNQITIRGITQVRNSDAPVAVVVDGVQQVDPREFTLQQFDLQSVEVLRGPQGALYGRDAAGGAIIITTQQPTDIFAGHVMGGYGSGDEYSIEGAVSGPIIKDKLLFNVGVAYVDRQGYYENIFLNRKQDPYEDLAARGMLKWIVNDKLTVNIRYSHDSTWGGALNFWYQDTNTLADGEHLNPADPFLSTAPSANATHNYFYSNYIGEDRRSIDQVSVKADYDLGFATLTSVTAYDKLVEFVAGDQFPYTAGPTTDGLNGTQTQYTEVSAVSQELRLTSPSDQRLRWMVGAYFLHTQRFISSTTGDNLDLGIAQVERTPLFDDPANPTQTFFADDNHNNAYAVFGNVDYDILPHLLQASVGLRYDQEDRTQDVSPYNTGGEPGAVNRAMFDKLQPKYTLTYKPLADLSLYGSYGIGFRSGQFNQNGTAAAAAAAGQPGLSDLVPEETTKTGEIGFKSQFLDHRLTLSGDLYDTVVRNSEYFVFIGAVGAQVLVPIDKTHLRGGEVEANGDLGNGFTAIFGFGGTQSRIDQYSVNPADVGHAAPYVPDTTWDAGLQFRHKLNEKLGILARVDYHRLGRQFWDPENTTERSPVNLVDLRFGFEDPAGKWSLLATVQNAGGAVYNAEYVLGGFSEIANPRVYRVQLRYNF